MGERMTDEEYESTQAVLTSLAAMMAELDLEGFLERIGTADSVGAILNPMLYIQAEPKLRMVRELANAGLGVKRVVVKHREALCRDAG